MDDAIASSRHNTSIKQITKSSSRTVSQNYYTPLQTIDNDTDDEVIIETAGNNNIKMLD